METIINKAYVILDKDTRVVLWVALSIEKANEWVDLMLEYGLTFKGEYEIEEVPVV